MQNTSFESKILLTYLFFLFQLKKYKGLIIIYQRPMVYLLSKTATHHGTAVQFVKCRIVVWYFGFKPWPLFCKLIMLFGHFKTIGDKSCSTFSCKILSYLTFKLMRILPCMGQILIVILSLIRAKVHISYIT